MQQSFFSRLITPQVIGMLFIYSVINLVFCSKTWCSSSSNEAETPYIKRKYQVNTWNDIEKLPLSQHHFVEHQIKHRQDQHRVTLWQEGYVGFWSTLIGAEKYMGETSHINLFMESIQHKSAHDLYQNPPKVQFQNPTIPPENEMLIGIGLGGTTITHNHAKMLKALTDWMTPQETQARSLSKGNLRSCVEKGIREEAWTLFHLMMSEHALLSQMEETYSKFLDKAKSLYDLINQGKNMNEALSKAVLMDDVRLVSEKEFQEKTHALNLGLRQLERDMEKRRLFVNTLRDNFRLPDGRDTSWTPWNLLVKANITYNWRDQFMTGTLNPMIQPDHVQTVYAMFEGHVIQGNEDRRTLIFGHQNPVFVPVVAGPIIKNAASSSINTNGEESS